MNKILNAYDLAMELVQSTLRLEDLMNEKELNGNLSEGVRLDRMIDAEEVKLHEIKNRLKDIKL